MSESKTAEIIFRARGLTKVYRMGDVEVRALRGIDLELFQGEFVVMLGPSGSGKSTLLNILGGLDTPTAGEVWYHGEDLSHADDARLTRFRREHVGFVFQFYNLIPSLTARENVAIVTEIAPNPLPPAEALALVGLEGRLDHFPAQLSGGEQQRVALARALLAEPQVMLLDEPFSSLDTVLRSQLQAQVREQVVRCAVPAVLLSHDPAEACLTADAIALLADGRIIQHGTPQQILARPASAAAARLLGCLNVSETRYVPPDAIRLGGEGESCRIAGIFRQPERWRIELDHPQLGRLTTFCEQAERPDWDGHCKAAVDYARIVGFDPQAA